MKDFPMKRAQFLLDEVNSSMIDVDCCIFNASMLEDFSLRDGSAEAFEIGEESEKRAKRAASILIKLLSRV